MAEWHNLDAVTALVGQLAGVKHILLEIYTTSASTLYWPRESLTPESCLGCILKESATVVAET